VNLQEYGLDMRKKVLRGTGIPVSVGIAPTKALAKAANRIAKKFTARTGGSYVIDTEDKRIKALKWLPVDDVWGIGRRNAKKLNAIGVKTAYDFCLMDRTWVLNHMTIVGVRLQDDLNGIPTLGMEPVEIKKSIATTRTFERDYSTYEEVKERVSTFAVSCAEKLRQQHSLCTKIEVFIQSNRFKENEGQYSNSIAVKLPFPTSSSIEIVEFALQGLQTIYKKGIGYKRAGVVLMNFEKDTEYQQSLFTNSNPKHALLMEAMDHINSKFGTRIRLAVQDKKTHKMRQEKLSPCYTTRINDLITVHLK